MAGLNAKKVVSTSTGNKQDAMEAGTYPCRLVQIIDKGIQDQRPHKGQAKPPFQTVRFVWEFTDEFCLDEDGKEQLDKPRWLKDEFPFNNLDKDLATSTKRYKALDPEDTYDGDFTELLGLPANVTIVNNEGKGKNAGTIYNNVGAVTTMRKRDADKCAPLVGETTLFLMSEPDLEVFKSLPDWLQDDIKKAHDFAGGPLEALLAGKEPAKQDEPEPKTDPAQEPADTKEEKPW